METGVVLCKLAEMVQRQAKRNAEGEKRKLKFRVPMDPVDCNTHACTGSSLGKFHSRVNTSNFIKWCRELGVAEAVIFESEGLVLHKDEKRVILCLLDVARYAERVGLPSPTLVKMEREIELLEEGGSIDEIYQPEGAQLTNGKDSPVQLILLEELSKMGCSENRKANGHNNSFSPSCSPNRLSPSPSPSPSPRHNASRIPVRTPSSTTKIKKTPSPRSRSYSVPTNDLRRKKRQSTRNYKNGTGEGKEKESEGVATGDAGVPVQLRCPDRRQRGGSTVTTRSKISQNEAKAESTASVEERVMKRVKECTCQNKIVVRSMGKGKFTVKGASGRNMTVYARVSGF